MLSVRDRVAKTATMRATGVPRRDLLNRFGPGEFGSFSEYSAFIGQVIRHIGYANPAESCAMTFEPFNGLTDRQQKAILGNLAPPRVSASDLQRLGIVPLSVDLLRAYLPFGSHWSRQCFDRIGAAKYVLCDPFYCSALYRDGERWRQPSIAMDWLLERQATWPKELVEPYQKNPSTILNEGASLAAYHLKDLLDHEQLRAAGGGEIPEIVIRDPTHLEDLGGAFRSFGRHGGKVKIWFRGQNREYRMPDATEMVAKGLLLHREFRDPALIPLAYRQIDAFYSKPERLQSFTSDVMHWYDLANELMGPDTSATDTNAWQKSSLLQVYGCPTQSICLTASMDIAWWFATHQQITTQPATKLYERYDWGGETQEEWPCIYVLLVAPDSHPVRDAGGLSMRAQRQESGFIGNGGMLLRNGPARYIAVRLRLHPDLGVHHSLDESHLFPPPAEDELLGQLIEKASGLSCFPLLHVP
jgi:hypothetical protein